MSKPTRWACGVCLAEYPTQAEADECERVPVPPPSVAVGDIVTARAGFGWYDGDRKWIANADAVDPDRIGNPGPINRNRKACPARDSNCFGECCTFLFYYVVTNIDMQPGEHRVRYHLATRAMTGKQGYHLGYTFDQHHLVPRVVTSPPRYVVRSSKVLIGQKATTLI